MNRSCRNTLLVCFCFLVSSAVAQETNSDKEESTHRLPNNYGKLALNDEQREKVYAIQDEYGEKIEALYRQIEDLQAEQSLEMQSLLTEGQKLRLKELIEEARQEREERAASN